MRYCSGHIKLSYYHGGPVRARPVSAMALPSGLCARAPARSLDSSRARRRARTRKHCVVQEKSRFYSVVKQYIISLSRTKLDFK